MSNHTDLLKDKLIVNDVTLVKVANMLHKHLTAVVLDEVGGLLLLVLGHILHEVFILAIDYGLEFDLLDDSRDALDV